MTNKIVEFDEMKIILMKYNELCSNYSLDDNTQKKIKKYQDRVAKQLHQYADKAGNLKDSKIDCIESMLLNYIDYALDTVTDIQKHYLECISILNEWYQEEVFQIVNDKTDSIACDEYDESLYEYNDLNDLLLSIRKSVENARKDRKNNNYQDFSKHTFELIVKMVSLIEYI